MIRTRWALATLLAACLLAACSDDDPEPDIADPTPSATASSSAATVSPSPSESATPVLGPEETVQAWVRLERGTSERRYHRRLRAYESDQVSGL